MKTLISVLALLCACATAEEVNEPLNGEVALNRANPMMIWGPVTNFVAGETSGRSGEIELRSGIDVKNGLIILSGGSLEPTYPPHLYLENHAPTSGLSLAKKYDHGIITIETSPTNHAEVFFPPTYERFNLVMTDQDGGSVPLTAAGMAISKPTELKSMTPVHLFERNHQSGILLLPKEVIRVPFFNPIGTKTLFTGEGLTDMCEIRPAKYFVLKKSGLYKLTMVQRLYLVDTNLCLKTVALPPVTVQVKVDE